MISASTSGLFNLKMVISGAQLILSQKTFVPSPFDVYCTMSPTRYSPTGYLWEYDPLRIVVLSPGIMNCPPWEWPDICSANLPVVAAMSAKSGS